MTNSTRRDFAQRLYGVCQERNHASGQALAAKSATWLPILCSAIQHTSIDSISRDHWVSAIAAAIHSSRIDCMPGEHHANLSYRRVVRLVGAAPSIAAVTARPGSLKRAAIEAEQKSKRPTRQPLVIDFGCTIPFSTIPPLIEKGFQLLDKAFLKGDQKVLEHYHFARQCLLDCLGDTRCDVMLLMVLTLASSSVTPAVAVKERQFGAGPSKDPSMFAANLVTRMLWFLQPHMFPWEEDDGAVLSIKEMTKKIGNVKSLKLRRSRADNHGVEHKGVSNRILRELGWVRVVYGNRDTPRNSELVLQEASTLQLLRGELLRLRSDPEAFIGKIFHSHDYIWVERCAAITKTGRVKG